MARTSTPASVGENTTSWLAAQRSQSANTSRPLRQSVVVSSSPAWRLDGQVGPRLARSPAGPGLRPVGPARAPRQRERRGGALDRLLGDSAPRLRWTQDDAPLFRAMLRSPHAEQRLGEDVGGLVDPPEHVGASFLARGARVGSFEWRGLVHAPTTQASFGASVQRVPGQLASAERVPNARDGGTLDRDRSARGRESVPARPLEVLGVALRAPKPDSPSIRTCPDPFTENFCSSFGVESAGERMAPTPFALISGSGHQHFLGTAGDLMVACTANHFRSALFGTWLAADEGSSFRWDPADDRRYALLADDPTASGNKPKTIWGANRLAFEALRLFPCIRAKGQRATVGWRTIDEEEVWRWPLWSCDLAPQVFSSILASGDLWRDEPDARARLRTRGVFAVYQSRRLTVGRAPNQKLNLTPAVPVWTSALG